MSHSSDGHLRPVATELPLQRRFSSNGPDACGHSALGPVARVPVCSSGRPTTPPNLSLAPANHGEMILGSFSHALYLIMNRNPVM
jgi:hypothetical protein